MKPASQTLFLMIWLSIFQLTSGHAEETQAIFNAPSEAKVAVQDYLSYTISRVEKDPKYFDIYWEVNGITDYSKIEIGIPYAKFYMNEQAIIKYSESSDDNPFPYAELEHYGYPVYYGEKYIGTINIRQSSESKWVYSGRHIANNEFDPLIFKARNRYPESNGFHVANLRTRGAGNYIVVLVSDEIMNVSPVNSFGASILEINESIDNRSVFIESSIAIPLIKKQARAIAMNKTMKQD